MVVPGTWIFPYEPQILAAGERGLIVTQHHVNTLGLDTYRWPKTKPMSYLSDPASLVSAWTKSASEYPKNIDVLWSVGFRGQNDYPFWQDDPNAPTTDEGRAGIIRAAIDKQIEIVQAIRPQPEILMNAWRESATFIHERVLKIPDGVTLVWPDNGRGLLQDQGEIAKGEGEYYHTAMYDYMSNHYSEMVPLERIQRELGRATKAGATRWLLVNTANVRPVVMTTRAVMELAWNPAAWVAPNSTEHDTYLAKWATEEFGARAAPAIVDYYNAYFAAPARYGTPEDATAGDNLYHTVARNLLLSLLDGSSGFEFRLKTRIDFKDTADLTSLMLKICREADARWIHARALADRARPLVAKDRLAFFQANVLTQVDLHEHFNRMVIDLAEMAQAPEKADQIARLKAAIAEAEAGEAALHAAEYGKWKDFYTAGDWLLDTSRTLALARTYLDHLEGRPMAENAIVRAKDTGFAYFRITAYQGTQSVQYLNAATWRLPGASVIGVHFSARRRVPTSLQRDERRPTLLADPTAEDPNDLRAFMTITRTHKDDIGDRQVVARLDGGPRVTLLFGESFTSEIRPGAHHLRVHNTLVWKNIRFTVEPGEHIEFIVVNMGRWWTAGMVGLLGSAPLFLRVEKRSLA